MEFDVKVSLNRPASWVAEYDGKVASAKSEYRLISEGDGSVTRLSYHSVIKPKGFLTNVFSSIIRYFVKRVFAGEINGFKKAIEEEYNPANVN